MKRAVIPVVNTLRHIPVLCALLLLRVPLRLLNGLAAVLLWQLATRAAQVSVQQLGLEVSASPYTGVRAQLGLPKRVQAKPVTTV